MIEFRVLGPLEVAMDGRPVAVGSPQQRALLVVLLLHRGEVVPADRLIDELWGESPPASASKIVQGHVSHLRRALGDETLVTQGHGYALSKAAGHTDAERFEALVKEGRRSLEDGDAAVALERLRNALSLWRGPPLADFSYRSFAQPEIARLGELRSAALEDRIDAELALGEHARLVGELEALVREHPLRDRLIGQLMLAQYRSGRQVDALNTYREARRRLVDELGLDPGPELQQLERAILAQDPALAAPERRSLRSPSGPHQHAGRRRGGLLILVGGVLSVVLVVAVALNMAAATSDSVSVAGNSLAAINPANDRVVGAVPVGNRPGTVVFGSGSLWIANLDDQTISRVSPAKLRVQDVIPVGGPATGVAVAAGSLWVVGASFNPESESASSVSVGRIDPEYNSISFPLRIGNVIPGPGAVAAAGHSLWVAPANGLLTRFNAVTGRVTGRLDPNSSPGGIAITPDGAVWLTDSEANEVMRIDPTGLRTPIPVGNTPTAITAGDGAVWVVDSLDDAVERIDPGSRSITGTISVGVAPSAVAVGDGSVWVANAGSGTVTRIDPATDQIQATIHVGGSPAGIAVADGRVWVTVDAQSVQSARGSQAGGTLRIVSGLDIDSMDPAIAGLNLSWQLLQATCAKLVNYPDKPGAGSLLTPEVAESLPTRSADGRTYTFTIRPGFRFSPPSDQPVTAQTFKYTIERTLSHRTQSELDPFFTDIVGARAFIAGRADHISGVTVTGDRLIIRLTAPAPDFPTRMALPAMCAVPVGTPITPVGERTIPSAGPYYVSSYTPGEGVVLLRNPNYHGNRPYHFARIELSVGVPAQRAVSEIEAGTADYTTLDATDYNVTPEIAALATKLASRFGAGSPSAAHGRQQYFVNSSVGLDFFYLNTHRSLFSDVRVRQAVNYAIDRRKLAEIGDGFQPLPEPPTDHYLPPGIPGYRVAHVYPLSPDLAKARQLIAAAHAARHTVVLDTDDLFPAPEQAQIVKDDLARIGLRVRIATFPTSAYFSRLANPRAPFDMANDGWLVDYPDPDDFLNNLLENSTVGPTFRDPVWQRRLAAAARLSGPERYLNYGSLDLELARGGAPLAAFGNPSARDFFSARIGCQTYGLYGMDLAALCVRPRPR